MKEMFVVVEKIIHGNYSKENIICEINQEPSEVYKSKETLSDILQLVKLMNQYQVKDTYQYSLDFELTNENKIFEIKCNKEIHGEEPFLEFDSIEEFAKYFKRKASLLVAENKKIVDQRRAIEEYRAEEYKNRKRR